MDEATEAALMRAGHQISALQSKVAALQAEAGQLRAALERSSRGEHICLKCGLRQDAYDAAGHAAAYPGF